MDKQQRPTRTPTPPAQADPATSGAGPGNAALAAQLSSTHGLHLLEELAGPTAFPIDLSSRSLLPARPADQAGVAGPFPAPARGPLSPDGIGGKGAADWLDAWWAHPLPEAPLLPERLPSPTPMEPPTFCGGSAACAAGMAPRQLKSPPIPIPGT